MNPGGMALAFLFGGGSLWLFLVLRLGHDQPLQKSADRLRQQRVFVLHGP